MIEERGLQIGMGGGNKLIFIPGAIFLNGEKTLRGKEITQENVQVLQTRAAPLSKVCSTVGNVGFGFAPAQYNRIQDIL